MIIRAINIGFNTAFQSLRVVLIVYAVQIMMAGIIGYQVMNVFEASIGNSLEISKVMHGYNNTVVTDFLNSHGASITPLIGQLRWIILLYIIISIYIHGGLMYCVSIRKVLLDGILDRWS